MDKQELVEGTIKAIENFFAEDGWGYDFDEEKVAFRTGTRLDNKLKSTSVNIFVTELGISVFANVSVSADKDCVVAVNEFLTRANYGLRIGNFEMNYETGDIAYKVFHDITDGVPSKDVIKRMIYTACMMVSRYGNGLLAVMFGMQSPKEAIETAENNSNAE